MQHLHHTDPEANPLQQGRKKSQEEFPLCEAVSHSHGSPSRSLHHVHRVLGEEGVDAHEGGAELAVSAPAAQHELVETLRTHGWPAQIHLSEKER